MSSDPEAEILDEEASDADKGAVKRELKRVEGFLRELSLGPQPACRPDDRSLRPSDLAGSCTTTPDSVKIQSGLAARRLDCWPAAKGSRRHPFTQTFSQ